MRFSNGIELTDAENGLLVRQFDKAHVAKRWTLCAATVELVQGAIDSGLPWMIRDRHPLANAHYPGGKGVVYLAFSKSPSHQWSLAVDTVTPSRNNFGFGAFNGKYQAQFNAAAIEYSFETRNKGAGHLIVQRPNVAAVLRKIGTFDHATLDLGRTDRSDAGFATEYDIQNAIVRDWAQTPFGAAFTVVQAEFPVDGGLGSRRIDVLAKNPMTGDWLVVEVKRAEAHLNAVQQIEGYLGALGRRDDFGFGRIDGALVAERISEPVRQAAAHSGIMAFEASYPFALRRVA